MGIIDQTKFQELKLMGFTEQQIQRAMSRTTPNSSTSEIIDLIYKQNENNSDNTNTNTSQNKSIGITLPTNSNTSNTNVAANLTNSVDHKLDSDIQRAIQLSLKESNSPALEESLGMYNFLEPNDPNFRQRETVVFSGLQSLSKIYYLNSLIQSYFFIPNLREQILKFQPTENQWLEDIENKNQPEEKRGPVLIHELQRLFSQMISSNSKYSNPKTVMKLIIHNDIQNIFLEGKQLNVSHFHNNFCDLLHNILLSFQKKIKSDNNKKEDEENQNEKKKETETETEIEKEKEKEKDEEGKKNQDKKINGETEEGIKTETKKDENVDQIKKENENEEKEKKKEGEKENQNVNENESKEEKNNQGKKINGETEEGIKTETKKDENVDQIKKEKENEETETKKIIQETETKKDKDRDKIEKVKEENEEEEKENEKEKDKDQTNINQERTENKNQLEKEEEKKEKEEEKEEKGEKEKEKEKEIQKQENQKEEFVQQEVITQPSQTFISKIFYLDTLILKSGLDENEIPFEKEKKKQFKEINVLIRSGDLYSSLEDYTLQISEKQIKKEIIFLNAPKVLTFQLDRETKDPEDGNKVFKQNTKFKFEKEIFLDRYLFPNLEKTRNSREQIKELQTKKQNLLKELNHFENFDKSTFPIDLSLKNALDYFNTTKEKTTTNNNSEKDEKEIEFILNILTTNLNIVEKKIDSLKKHIQEQEIQMKNIFEKNKQFKYILHSILVHKGEINNGNYYVYIHDSIKKIWYKFADREVTIVNEDIVMNESIGHYKQTGQNCSSFCLTYLSQDLCEKTLREYLENQKEIIPNPLKKEIKKQNSKLIKEINKWEREKKEQKMKGKIEEIKKGVDAMIKKEVLVQFPVILSDGKKPSLLSLINFAHSIEKTKLVKKIILDKVMEKYLKKKKKKKQKREEEEEKNKIEEKEKIEKQKKMGTEKEIEIIKDSDFVEIDSKEILKKERKKKQLLKRINRDIVRLTETQIQKEMTILKYEFALFKAYHQQFLSAMENILNTDFLQALLELYELKKRSEINQTFNLNLDFETFITLCIKEIIDNSFQILRNDLLNLDDSIIIEHLNQIQIATIISYKMSEIVNEEEKEATIEFLLDQNPENKDHIFTKSKENLESIKNQLISEEENKKINSLTEINNILDLFNEPKKNLEFNTPLPDLSKFKQLEDPLADSFEKNYKLILEKYSKYFL
ncbi:ubiquitin carboxyl-terminal hydrolase 28 [Anaeramoeba flamelloides]|uniref:Ubiquitin carboxyl-terminal hydrolase 28 n=1 Tax=Anaeramoeba flamelloides TaxID=1746091 RepID=A0ABQ8XFY6_9EUKA|nr:ubiquitin carboxyl-terminal hydrolase 28 [Anaeramoeba flamelloides]